MASRAEPAPALPIDTAERSGAPTRAGGVLRVALQDAFYHAWRLVPANLLWTIVAIVVLAAAAVTPFALLLVPLLALPTAGIFRVTTRIVRGEAVSFGDALDAWRIGVRTTLATGAAVAAAAAILITNVVTGFASDSPLGWGLATLAIWGLIALWLFAWTLWPLLLDPHRAERPAVERARLAALIVLAHPVRTGVLATFLAALLVASTVAMIPLAVISLSFGALIASRFVLPAADRLEDVLGARRAGATATIDHGEPPANSAAR